jgi:hypothetical protein
MLREWWKKLTNSGRDEAVEREIEREEGSPAERSFEGESVEGHAADAVAEEHLGGFDPLRTFEEDDAPR